MPDLAVRRATPHDAAAIGRVHVRGWHEAYAGRMPQSILDGLDEDRLALGWERIIRGEHPGEESDVWVGLAGGDLVGFTPYGAVKLDDRWGEPVREVRLTRAARLSQTARSDRTS